MNKLIPNPDHPSAERWCLGTHESVTGVHLSPAGGERFGSSTIVSGTQHELVSKDAAFLALWKARACLLEEMPYGSAESPAVRSRIASGYREFYEFLGQQSPIDIADNQAKTKFMDWLSGRPLY